MKQLHFSSSGIIFLTFLTVLCSCSKKEAPSVTTTAPTNVTVGGASSGGDVTDIGKNSGGITDLGVCYSSSNGSPGTADSRISSGAGSGIFTSILVNLKSNTTYYVRAYATNEKGTAYGASIPFHTLANITSVYPGLSASVPAIFFSDPNHGWAVGGAGLIMATTDGGQTWNRQASGTTAPLFSIYFINAQTGWAVSSTKAGGNIILSTTNGGSNWSIQTSGISADLYGITFTDLMNGWAVGSGGVIMHTTNGGASWSSKVVGSAIYKSVAFTSATTGYAAGASGTIIATADGGSTWTNQSSGSTSNLNAVFFCSPSTGCIAGENGALFITSDAGKFWRKCGGIDIAATLYGVYMYDASHFYAAGTILGSQAVLYAGYNGGNAVTETLNSDPLFYGIYGNTQHVFLGGVNAIYEF